MLCEALFPKRLTGAWCLHLECLHPRQAKTRWEPVLVRLSVVDSGSLARIVRRDAR